MNKINVALVGCGYVSSSHLKAWRKLPFFNVAAVCDPNKKAAEEMASKWNISRIFTSVDDLLYFDEVQLWDICTPIQTHAEIAIKAMKNGFDILVEKPLTLSSSEAKTIVDCQKDTNRRAGVIHNWLFEPPVLKVRSIIEKGSLGEIIAANLSILHTKDEPMAANAAHWTHKLPGGRFTEMLIHPIYLMRHFLGGIQVKNVAVSKAGDYSWMKYDELTATFQAGNKLGVTYASFNAPRNSIFIDIFGRKGIARADIINATVKILPPCNLKRLSKGLDSLRQAFQDFSSTISNASNVITKRWFDGHEMCIRLFGESLIKNTPPPVSLEEAFAVVQVLEDTYKLIESN